MNSQAPANPLEGYPNQSEALAAKLRERNFMLDHVLRGQGEMLNQARRSLDLLEAVFNAMAEGIVVTDTTGRITQVNHATLRIFNASEEELLGKSCDQLLAEGTTCPHQSFLNGSQSNRHRRDLMSRAGDRLLDLRVREVSNGVQHKGYVHVMNDVTRQRLIERQLIHTDRLSLAGMMVSMFAHEAATPLGVIMNATDLLMKDQDIASSDAELLRKIKHSSHRVVDMMRNMLSFVRNKPESFAELDLTTLAREAIDMMNYELGKAQINATLESEHDVPPVLGDRAQLLQVLLNLIKNAKEAMPEGGRLVVRIGRETSPDGRWRVTMNVDDSGPGICLTAMERLFDFFYTTRAEGTGLGLAISRQIVEGHGGEITADNLDGGGARFGVKLPAAIAGHAYDERNAQIVLAARN